VFLLGIGGVALLLYCSRKRIVHNYPNGRGGARDAAPVLHAPPRGASGDSGSGAWELVTDVLCR